MIGDLHLHTRYSDGSLWPREALVQAKSRGLGFVSFVDHDTTAGTATAASIGLRMGMTVVPGVEISAYDPERDRKVHILGYNYRMPAEHIEALCRPLRQGRDTNTRKQVEEIIAAGYSITLDQVVGHARGPHFDPEIHPEPALFQQHIMLALIDAGYTDTITGELYRTLFGGGGVAAHDIEYADARDAVRAIRADGGVPVLAHPGQLDSWDTVPDLVEAGLRGIEVIHGDHTSQDRERARELATTHDLIMTGGSDDHGAYGSVHAMGDVCAPSGAFEALTRPTNPEVAWAIDLVREAGAMARSAVAEEAGVELKGGDIKDLVTMHDLAIDQHLTTTISKRYPDHGFLTEEHDHPEIGGDQDYWVIDPIDGTTNFVTRRDYFAISVGHYKGDTPVFGIVYDVMQDELYLGIHGEGAWLNGVRLPMLGGGKPLKECVIEVSLNAVEEFAQRRGASREAFVSTFRATRSSGSAALGICRVARDTLDIYLSSALAVWDYAAGAIILREVGGDWQLFTSPVEPNNAVTPATIDSAKGPFIGTRHPDLMREALAALFPEP